MSDGIRIVTNRQRDSLMREFDQVRKAMLGMTGWVGQREAYRLARISKPALICARIHGKIEAVRVGKELPIWLYSAASCEVYR
jgi:hypothetical protein